MAKKELKEKVKNETDSESEVKLYELGIHLIPTLTEEEASAKLAEINAKIEKIGGVVKSSKNPESRPLAYEISKSGGGKKEKYESTFFTFIIFEMKIDEINAFQKWVNTIPERLRSIVIEVPKDILVPKERRIPQSHKEEIKRTTEPTKEAKPIDEAELDKTIEQLVIE
ncbi:MAG: 30S ribosomal protein S6 [Patescibacteria group bacterium]